MNAELKAAWVAALRSGEYQQTTGTLERNDAYCCMGVLCVVAEKTGFVKAERGYNGNPDRLKGNYLTAQLVGNELPHRFDDKLAALNDKDGKNFTQIADWIEANVPVSP